MTGIDDPEPEPFNPSTDCSTNPNLTDGTGRCELTEACKLRCHIRFLDGQMQPNDSWADHEQAAAWRRYYNANPGTEAAMKAACDPKTYEEKTR